MAIGVIVGLVVLVLTLIVSAIDKEELSLLFSNSKINGALVVAGCLARMLKSLIGCSASIGGAEKNAAWPKIESATIFT